MGDPLRVVLVKPGDVLMVGGVQLGTELDAELLKQSVEQFKKQTGISHIVMFEDDVTLSVSSELPVNIAELLREHDFDRIECLSDHRSCCSAGCHDVQVSQYEHYAAVLKGTS